MADRPNVADLADVFQPPSPTPDSPVTKPLPPRGPEQLAEELALFWEPFVTTPPEPLVQPALRIGEGDVGGCSFGVAAQGLPAIDTAARVVVDLHIEQSAGGDVDDSKLALRWRDYEGHELRRVDIYDGAVVEIATDSGARKSACRRHEAETRARLDLVNREFGSTSYAGFTTLGVQISPKPHLDLPTPPLSARGSERPVEVLYHGGFFIARVPGLRVLVSQEHTDWLAQTEQSLDSFAPNILGVVGHRQSGVAIVYMDHESASCMSDPTVYSAIVELPEALFGEVEARVDNVWQLRE